MIISQIVLQSTDFTETIVLNEYDNFRDVEIVLELNEDDYHYYANINNVKVFYPIAQQLINSLKSYRVNVYIDNYIFSGYLTFDDIEIVHDEYVILNIQMNTHNKLILDLYSTLVDSSDNVIKRTYAILNTAASYPRSSAMNFLVSFYQFVYSDLMKIMREGYEDFAEGTNPFTIQSFLTKKPFRIAAHIITDIVFNIKIFALFRLIKDLIRNTFQIMQYANLKELVEYILQKNDITDYDISFINDDLYLVTSNEYFLARDVFDFIKKYYNVYINVYEINGLKNIRFIKATQNNYTNFSYSKIKKRDSFMLKNVNIVRFSVDNTNNYSIKNFHVNAVGSVSSFIIRNSYEKIIESASKSNIIEIKYSLYSKKLNRDLLDYLILLITFLIATIIPTLSYVALQAAVLGQNFFHVVYVLNLLVISILMSSFIINNYKVKKDVLIVSNITPIDFVVKVKDEKEIILFSKQTDELILHDSFEVLKKLKDTYEDTYYRYIYNEKTYMSFQDFVQLISNPTNIKSVRYKVYDEVLEGEIYENVLANVQYTDRFV